MSYSDIYFAITSISTIAVAGLLVLALFCTISILHDVKRLSKIAKREAEIIARGFEKGANVFGGGLSEEAAGFVRAIFAILLSRFAEKTSRKGVKKVRTKDFETKV